MIKRFVSICFLPLLACACVAFEPEAVGGRRFGYVVYADRVVYQGPTAGFFPANATQYELKGADPRTFVVEANLIWGRDAKHVWFEDKLLVGADAATFRHVGSVYAADARFAWWLGTRLLGANGADLRVVRADQTVNSQQPVYATDGFNVWLHDLQLEEASGATFRAFADGYATDGVHAYFEHKLVPGAVGETHQLGNDKWALDSQGVYFRWEAEPGKVANDRVHRVTVCDPATLKLMPWPTAKETEASDDQCVYFEGKRIPLTDRASYRNLGYGFSRDANAVFGGTTLIPGIDPEAVTVVVINYTGVLRDGQGRCWNILGQTRECPTIP